MSPTPACTPAACWTSLYKVAYSRGPDLWNATILTVKILICRKMVENNREALHNMYQSQMALFNSDKISIRCILEITIAINFNHGCINCSSQFYDSSTPTYCDSACRPVRTTSIRGATLAVCSWTPAKLKPYGSARSQTSLSWTNATAQLKSVHL